MAESAKRKSGALEGKNAIEMFSREDEMNLPESQTFFRLLLQTHLSREMKWAGKA